jgi:hypothetical protein
MKTSELQGAALDWAVAKCDQPQWSDEDALLWVQDDEYQYNPSTDWALAGPIIEREKLGVWWATHYVDDDGVEYGNHWYAEPGCTDDNADKPYSVAFGPTPLIAAMRCYVASQLGDEVKVPGDTDDEQV